MNIHVQVLYRLLRIFPDTFQCIYLEGDIILAIEHVVRLVFGRDIE